MISGPTAETVKRSGDLAVGAGRPDEAIIFLHLPKTAGTTLNRLIEWEYGLSEMYSIDPVLFEWSAAHLRKLPLARLRKTRMFKGHMLFGLHAGYGYLPLRRFRQHPISFSGQPELK